jgi:hypothetical protein
MTDLRAMIFLPSRCYFNARFYQNPCTCHFTCFVLFNGNFCKAAAPHTRTVPALSGLKSAIAKMISATAKTKKASSKMKSAVS